MILTPWSCLWVGGSGADIVYGPMDQEYGGCAYACLDPEGNIWHFGSYDPWAADSAEEHG